MNKDINFKTDDYTFSIRTVGVTVRDGKVLLQRENDGNEYALPGGTVKLGETSIETLVREYKEETGDDIIVNRLIWTEENFWKYGGKKQHSIAFYYLVDFCDEANTLKLNEFVSQKDNCNVVLGWMPIEELKNITVYPTFLKDETYNLDSEIKHFISRE